MAQRLLLSLFVIFFMASCITRHEENNNFTMDINENWEFRQAGDESWLPARVPGTVHTDLLRNKLIDDPYYRLNEKGLQWIDKADWEYRTTVIADFELLKHEFNQIVFEGLDTYAKVYLNGEMILDADNMFRSWKVDVSGKLKAGDNELRILLESPTRKGLEAMHAYGFQLAADNDQSETGEMGQDRVSPYVRKAPYHFGWDWGPRLVTSGIWRPVELRAWSNARIGNLNIVLGEITAQKAMLSTKLQLDVNTPGSYDIRIVSDTLLLFQEKWNLEHGTWNMEAPLVINNPKLWWPNGYGSQALYNFRVELSKGHQVIDSAITTTGVRRVELVREPDPDGKGESFYFKVNDRPVFAKGANYIPNDIFLDRVSPERYEFIVKSAAEANMNMLRVWGGGIYENDIFYDLCDRYGIMVWQDFMFACAMYPGNDSFLENVRQEAIDNVRRLRTHPSIVLWCGNNEIEAAWGPYEENRGWGWKQRYTQDQKNIIWKAYDTLFHHILPNVVEQEDPNRFYWHSSPSAGMGKLASYETTSGDMHYWGVWHGQHPFTDFRKYKARFMSEYGFQAFPEFNSVKKYTLPEDYNIESEVMMSHQRSGIGNLRIKQYMGDDYIVPVDFEQFLYVGQLLQAEAIKTAIESHRSEMPYCMGSLYWQMNDCWPVASWSGIDYYGKWKALHYFVKEAFKPTAIVCTEDGGFVKIKVVSDEAETGKLKLEIRLIDFNGQTLWESENRIEMPSQELMIAKMKILGINEPAAVVLVSYLKEDEKVIDRDLHYFVKPKDLKLPEPSVSWKVENKGGLFDITIKSDKLAKNVFLYADDLEEQFSDNFFDMLPGETIHISIPKDGNTMMQLKSLNMLHLSGSENQSKINSDNQ